MYIGADAGCQEVPEPIAPIEITLLALEPTRMPMSPAVITGNAPGFGFVESMPGMSLWVEDAGVAAGDAAGDAWPGMTMPGV
jgi:hypothetical protein